MRDLDGQAPIRQSALAFDAVAGTTYYLQVGGWNTAAGALNLRVTSTEVGPSCQGEAATHWGTVGNDVLTGTSGRDVIVGFGGNDTINGLNGNDLICAGAGNDKVFGNGGADEIYGQGGNDTIDGGAGWPRQGVVRCSRESRGRRPGC